MLDQPLATSKMIAEKDGAIGRLIFNNPARTTLCRSRCGRP